MSESSYHRLPLPQLGPHAQDVVDQLLARVTELDLCEHGPGDFAFWIVTRPGMLLCRFCYVAAQDVAGEITCTACGQPAGNPDQDALVVAKPVPWLGVHFYLCSVCSEFDLSHN